MPTKKKRQFLPQLYWLLHHAVLLEATSEPVKNRIRYIKRAKPGSERPIRLRWLRKVKRPDLLPKPIQVAFAKLIAARQEENDAPRGTSRYWTARILRMSASHLLRNVIARHISAVMKRHRLEYPGCPFRYKRYCRHGRRHGRELIFP